VEQDDTMEKSNDVNEQNTYVSHYPDIRRYSMANVMATTNRPQQYSANTTQEEDDNREETKIDIPSSEPPHYSQAIADKLLADKKVKVSKYFYIFSIVNNDGRENDLI
jgi:hypothetical protein